jgi:hypothetical protein
MSHRKPHPDACPAPVKEHGFLRYEPTRRERRRRPQDTKPHYGALRGGRPYFVTEKRKRPKLSRWLDPDLRCH